MSCPETSELRMFFPGTEVLILQLGERATQIKGIVIETLIGTSNQVSYKVAWWAGNDRQEQWLSDCEVSSTKDFRTAKPIGF